MRPCLTFSEEVTHVRLGVSIYTMPYEGQTALPWWLCLRDCCVCVYVTFCFCTMLLILLLK